MNNKYTEKYPELVMQLDKQLKESEPELNMDLIELETLAIDAHNMSKASVFNYVCQKIYFLMANNKF